MLPTKLVLLNNVFKIINILFIHMNKRSYTGTLYTYTSTWSNSKSIMVVYELSSIRKPLQRHHYSRCVMFFMTLN